jgi:hypothetical protein
MIQCLVKDEMKVLSLVLLFVNQLLEFVGWVLEG